MSTALLTVLLRALDLCVIERVPSKSAPLRLLTPAPIWLPVEGGQALGAVTPFLDHFLPQAEAAWHDGHQTASSGPFAITVDGEEVLLLATAISHHERRFLIVRRLTGDADVRPTLQRAREQVLEQERLVRQISALHPPCASIDRETKTLLAAPLAPDHHAVVERLNKASAEVQAVLATLPAPPARHRRQARSK